MTLSRIAFLACLIGFLASSIAFFGLVARYAVGVSPMLVFLDAGIMTKLGSILLILLAIVSLVLASINLATGRKQAALALLLRLLAGSSVLIGLLFAFYSWSTMQAAIRAIGPVSFDVTAITWAEIAMVLTLGFLPAVIALLGAVPVRVERRHRL